MQDPIVQTKTCHHCQSSFAITQGDLDFYTKISPTFDGQKFQIPTPTLCPDCRQRRRLSFRNERNLYRRSCDASGKQIISIYSPDKPYKVYDQKIWRSDGWDPMSYGRDFDFTRSFTEQFGELMREVPLASQFNTNSENSDYCNHVGDMKNSYLCSASWACQNCFYCSKVFECELTVDVYGSSNISSCYQLINCDNCYGSSFLIDSSSCSHSSYLINCIGCTDCFMSYNLKNCKYVYNNIQLDEESYKEKIKNNTYKVVGRDLFDFCGIIIEKHRTNTIINSDGCIGYRILNSFNCFECSNINNARDCKYISNGGEICNDVYDGFGIGYEQSLAYEIVDTGLKSFQNICTVVSHRNSNVYYSYSCYDSSHLFGCIGLRNKSYCIFNKQYTKDDYEKTVAKIINYMIETGEWGEFFHPSLSPFGYNETVAQEYYPVTPPSPSGDEVGTIRRGMSEGQGEVLGAFGYHRSTYEPPKPVADKVVQGKDLPESIDQVEDTILQSAIACEVTGKLFRIQPQELVFYRKHNIPLPRRHPDQRHLERLALRR